MRILLCLGIGGVLFAGCAGKTASVGRSKSFSAPALAKAPASPGKVTNTNAVPTVATGTRLAGKVAVVNRQLQFVVVDFSYQRLPPTGTVLSVYRKGQKVGALKTSGQANAGNVEADIEDGEAAVGDEVREN